MAQFHGVGINFGVGSTIVGVNGLFQTRDHHFKQNKREIKDGGETTVSVAYSDQMEEAAFTYIAYQPGPNLFGNALVGIPTLGFSVQIIDTVYPRIAGFWLVDDIEIQNSNTTAVRVTVKLSRYPNVLRV